MAGVERITETEPRSTRVVQASIQLTPELVRKLDGALMDLLIANVRDYAVFVLDAQGHVVTWNAGAQRLKGYAAEEILGKSFSTFYTALDVEAGKPSQELETARVEGWCKDEGWRVRKDGSRFWADVTITRLDDPETGAVLGFGKLVHDLSRRRQAEEALHEAYREVESFSHMVSHDLRAPLRAIHMLAERALEEAAPSEASVRAGLTAIQTEAIAASAIVQGLLDLAQRGEEAIHPTRLDLGEMAKRFFAHLQRAEPARHVNFSIVNKTALVAQADAHLIRLVLQNLLENAWNYTRGSHQPSIVFGAEHNPHGSTVFFVKDNGIGFDPAQTDRLFVPFVRLANARGFPGTGIGLATVKRIVTRHGGRVWAEGRLGEGATFSFTLPDADPIREK